MVSSMRRITLWLLSTTAGLTLLFGYHTSTSGPTSSASETVVAAPATPGTGSGSTAPATGSAAGSGSNATGSTVTGSVAQTRWGPVQVEITVANQAITDVSVVQYPNGNGRDQEINQVALPVLVDETMTAQSANIDMVSGATVTSEGYLQSLQSALDQATA